LAHLTDMEELVSSVQNEEIRDYMSESLACYMAGAYRASVVLTFIALFDDILAKLAALGKVNKKAKGIADAASQKRADQEVFETYLIDQLKTNSLLTALDAGFLGTLRDLRNKAAHPSGHQASAEEARFVFYEAVSRFLSRPILSTTQLADEVLNTFTDANLFPSTSIDVIVKVVKKELTNIHPQTYPYFVTKTLEKTQSPEADTAKNARFFLSGLARAADADAAAALKKYAVEKFASNKAHQSNIISLLCANGKLFEGLDDVTYQRIAVLVSDCVQNVDIASPHTNFSHPAALFVSLFVANESGFVLSKLGPQFDAFLERFTYSAFFGRSILPVPQARALLLSKLYVKAGSYDFGIANDFVKHASDIDKIMAEGLLPEEGFKLLVNVLSAADTGAFSAIDMRNAHFAATPKLIAKANEFLAIDVAAAKALAAAILKVPLESVDEHLAYLTPVPTE
jgi:hypothetical protein